MGSPNRQGKAITVTLSIRDVSGRGLYWKQIKITGQHTEQVDFSQQAAGVYLLNVAADKQQANLRLIRHQKFIIEFQK